MYPPSEPHRILGLDSEKCLVPAHHLDHHVQAAQGVHDGVRRRVVRITVDGQKNRIWQLLRRDTQGHPGSDAELSCLVRRRRDHASLGRVSPAPDDNRLTREFRMTEDLDRGDELVQIHMQHPPSARRSGHGAIVLHPSRRDRGYDQQSGVFETQLRSRREGQRKTLPFDASAFTLSTVQEAMIFGFRLRPVSLRVSISCSAMMSRS